MVEPEVKDYVDQKLTGIYDRMAGMESRMDGLDAKMDSLKIGLEGRMAGLDAKMDAVLLMIPMLRDAYSDLRKEYQEFRVVFEKGMGYIEWIKKKLEDEKIGFYIKSKDEK